MPTLPMRSTMTAAELMAAAAAALSAELPDIHPTPLRVFFLDLADRALARERPAPGEPSFVLLPPVPAASAHGEREGKELTMHPG